MQDQVLAKYKCDSLQFRAMHTSPVAPANKHRSRNQINVLASPRFPQCRWFIMSGQLTLMLLSGGTYLYLHFVYTEFHPLDKVDPIVALKTWLISGTQFIP